YAVPRPVSINPSRFQSWEKTADGSKWSHRVHAPNAVSLNFGFCGFYLPEGAELNIFSADRSKFIRSLTAEDNNVDDELWTPIIMCDDVIIDLSVPEQLVSEVRLQLAHVGQGFRNFGQS